MPVIIAPMVVTTVMAAKRRRAADDRRRAQKPASPMSTLEFRRITAEMERDAERRRTRLVHPMVWLILASLACMAVLIGSVCMILHAQGVPLPPLTPSGFLYGSPR